MRIFAVKIFMKHVNKTLILELLNIKYYNKLNKWYNNNNDQIHFVSC